MGFFRPFRCSFCSIIVFGEYHPQHNWKQLPLWNGGNYIRDSASIGSWDWTITALGSYPPMKINCNMIGIDMGHQKWFKRATIFRGKIENIKSTFNINADHWAIAAVYWIGIQKRSGRSSDKFHQTLGFKIPQVSSIRNTYCNRTSCHDSIQWTKRKSIVS